MEDKEQWRRKREEYVSRLANFTSLKSQRLRQKKQAEVSRKILDSEDLWEELESIIKQNEQALQRLEKCKKTEIKNQHTKRAEDELAKKIVPRRVANNVNVTETVEDEKLLKLYARIRELEKSVVTLDFQLERGEIEKMNQKTKEVKQRISQVAVEFSAQDLKPDTVEAFIKDDSLWEKYKIK